MSIISVSLSDQSQKFLGLLSEIGIPEVEIAGLCRQGKFYSCVRINERLIPHDKKRKLKKKLKRAVASANVNLVKTRQDKEMRLLFILVPIFPDGRYLLSTIKEEPKPIPLLAAKTTSS